MVDVQLKLSLPALRAKLGGRGGRWLSLSVSIEVTNGE